MPLQRPPLSGKGDGRIAEDELRVLSDGVVLSPRVSPLAD